MDKSGKSAKTKPGDNVLAGLQVNMEKPRDTNFSNEKNSRKGFIEKPLDVKYFKQVYSEPVFREFYY